MSTSTRRVLYGDNGRTLHLVPDASIDMIYMDPPFGSDRKYNGKHGRGFSDVWSWKAQEEAALADLHADKNPVLDGVAYDTTSDMRVHRAVRQAVEFAKASDDDRFTAYVLHMGVRLVHYKRVLKSTGNLVIHCDQTASHIIKAMVDAVFGRKRFRNEITWKRMRGNKSSTTALPRSHDTLLVWGRTGKAFYNPDAAHIPGAMTPENAARYNKDDHDGRGPYSLGDLMAPKPAGGESAQPWRGIDPLKRGGGSCWRAPREARKELGIEHLGVLAALDVMDSMGYIYWSKNGQPSLKRYARWYKGAQIDDIWTDINAVAPAEAERLGYPTQKPVALLERLIRLYCPEGGHVLDPFGGCGTTADAAERLGRSWTICDISIHAIDVIDRRMDATHGVGEAHGLTIEGDWPGLDPVKIDALPEAERRRYLSRLIGAASMDTDRKGDETQLDRGIHGHFSLKDCTTKPPQGILMIAPTGGNLTDITVLNRLRREDGAEVGVLICDAVTPAMQTEAVKSGAWTSSGPHGITVDRIQLTTVADVIARGVQDALPSGVRLDLPYVPVKR